MTNPITSVQPQQPVGAYSINDSDVFKVGRFVVNPPEIIPYSFYDDLKKGDGFFKDAIKIVATNEYVNTKEPKKNKSSFFKKAMIGILTVASGVLIYKNWEKIINFLRTLKS